MLFWLDTFYLEKTYRKLAPYHAHVCKSCMFHSNPHGLYPIKGSFRTNRQARLWLDFFFDRECPACHPKTYSSLLLYHQSLFMKYVQLTIKVKCHLVVWFGTKVPPGGIIWYWNATWWYNLVLKCYLAVIFGTKFDKSLYW